MASVRHLQKSLGQVEKKLAKEEAVASANPLARPIGSTSPDVQIGTSEMAIANPTLARQISDMVNRAYTDQMKTLLPEGRTYERLSVEDVEDRLEMGDAGPRANRVLHLAFRNGELVGTHA